MSEAITTPTDDLDELLQRGFRYAVSLTHDEHLARDVLQDACVALSRRGGPWHRGYLFAAIRNRVIDLHRRDQRVAWSSLEDPDALVDESHDDDSASETGADEADADRAIAVHDRELREALGKLKPEAREALFLSVVEGLTAREIAELTGRPRGTILSLIHRGRHRLRQLLAHRERSLHP